ncbi:MAG: sporulation protein YunB [Oscillibacter sp.]|nr:sporulation protein YunB [Oscillibacter sp.]
MGRLRFRFRYGGARIPLRFALCAALAAAVAAWACAVSQLQPVLSRLAVARASNTVNRIVARAVNEAVENGAISYGQLISFEKDNDGRIAAVHSNMAVCNRLQAEILDIILTRIEEVPARDLSIPVGTLSGSPLLAGRGPRISVRMESAGSSSARFGNTFTSAGINQTRHEIVLYIDVSVAILLPGFTTATKVSNAVTVAETVIVGAVPESYTYFSTNPADGYDDQKDYVLNG